MIIAIFRIRASEDYVLVISRINPSKKIENAITLARLLKEAGIGKGMIITGSLVREDRAYYHFLQDMIQEHGVSDYVSMQTSVGLNKMRGFMQKSKVYFHPLSWEPFGISVAEAMSAGLVPVVPAIGGQVEFTPARYHYKTLSDAARLVSMALRAKKRERLLISNSVRCFSRLDFIRGFQRILQDLILNRNRLAPELISHMQ